MQPPAAEAHRFSDRRSCGVAVACSIMPTPSAGFSPRMVSALFLHFWHAKNLRFLDTPDTRASRSMPSEAKACSKISTLVGIVFSERETQPGFSRWAERSECPPFWSRCSKMLRIFGTPKTKVFERFVQCTKGCCGWCRDYFYVYLSILIFSGDTPLFLSACCVSSTMSLKPQR